MTKCGNLWQHAWYLWQHMRMKTTCGKMCGICGTSVKQHNMLTWRLRAGPVCSRGTEGVPRQGVCTSVDPRVEHVKNREQNTASCCLRPPLLGTPPWFPLESVLALFGSHEYDIIYYNNTITAILITTIYIYIYTYNIYIIYIYIYIDICIEREGEREKCDLGPPSPPSP